jgi:hypothetical protein
MSDVAREHFITMLGHCWDQARLAAIPMQLTLRDGSVLDGAPRTTAHPGGRRRVDASGVATELELGQTAVATADVVAYAVLWQRTA